MDGESTTHANYRQVIACSRSAMCVCVNGSVQVRVLCIVEDNKDACPLHGGMGTWDTVTALPANKCEKHQKMSAHECGPHTSQVQGIRGA